MTEKQKKYEFICMDQECMANGQIPCVMTVYGIEDPDYPNYCPYELEPAEHKYHPWKRMKG